MGNQAYQHHLGSQVASQRLAASPASGSGDAQTDCEGWPGRGTGQVGAPVGWHNSAEQPIL